jgi:DNA polymerase-1
MTMNSTTAILDLETNKKHNTIWCVGIKIIGGQSEGLVLTTPSDLLSHLRGSNVKTIVGHNIIGFDLPVLRDVWGIDLWEYNVKIVDTLVMSRLFNPSLDGGHSLEAWGQRLGYPKIDFDDYDSGYSEAMAEYCIRDVEVTARLHQELSKLLRDSKFNPRSVDLEHEVARITDDMCRAGFSFDISKAEHIHLDHMRRMNAITAELQQRWPPIVTERWSEKTGKRLKDSVEEFNVGSRLQIAKRLESEGVEFKHFTETGRAKIDETTLAGIDHPAAQLCSEYLSLQKLSGMVESWLEKVDRETGRIHGYVNPCGAITGRMTHSNPNLGQIPRRGGSLYRELYRASEGMVLVGADASQLELRMLAHYMQDPEYTEAIISGDVHTLNQERAGLPTRDDAKTFIYAFLYGAGDAKIGSIVGGSAKDGKAIKAKFLSGLPKLAELKNKISKIAAKGSLPGLDGRRIRVRSEHAALNTLLQGAGAVVMKQAIVCAEWALQETCWQLLAQVHDEFQAETHPDTADKVGQELVNGIKSAGSLLQLRCPLDGEYKIGSSWAETH